MLPLQTGDHPELVASKHLDQNRIHKDQSLVGAIQWAACLGRLDINTSITTLSSFRAKPREGHLDRARRVVSYL